MKTTICPQCAKPFETYPSNHQRYCSRACQSAAGRVTSACPHCGKEFSWLKSWPRKYCSKACAVAETAKQNLGIVEMPALFCEVCGVEIPIGKRNAASRFCSRQCYGVFLARTRTGVSRPELRGERVDLQRRVAKTCPECGVSFQVKESHQERRQYCSTQCRDKARVGTISGPANFNWKGGYEAYYGPNWRQQRRSARRRDGYICQRCGVSEETLGRQLDVHHIVPFRCFGVERYLEANAMSNLVSLCAVCHLTVEHEQDTRPNPA